MSTDFETLNEQLSEIDQLIKDEKNHQEVKELLQQVRITLPMIREVDKKRMYQIKIKNYEEKLARFDLLKDKKTPVPIGDKKEQNVILRESLQKLVDTEAIAKDTSLKLKQQGEQLKKVSGNVQELDKKLSESERLTTKIERQQNPFWRLFGR